MQTRSVQIGGMTPVVVRYYNNAGEGPMFSLTQTDIGRRSDIVRIPAAHWSRFLGGLDVSDSDRVSEVKLGLGGYAPLWLTRHSDTLQIFQDVRCKCDDDTCKEDAPIISVPLDSIRNFTSQLTSIGDEMTDEKPTSKPVPYVTDYTSDDAVDMYEIFLAHAEQIGAEHGERVAWCICLNCETVKSMVGFVRATVDARDVVNGVRDEEKLQLIKDQMGRVMDIIIASRYGINRHERS